MRALLVLLLVAGCGEPAAPEMPDAGPLPALMRAGIDRAAWERGRAVFGRDYGAAVGPGFNARTCIACHAEGAIGGGGDVAVYQSGPRFLDGAEQVHAANEPFRTAPPLWMLGAIEEQGDAEITAGCGVDAQLGIAGVPGDVDQDGHVDRFGAKARTRTLLDFAAAALRNELGVETNAGPNERIRMVPDEIDPRDVDDLATFLRGLDRPVPPTPDLAGAMVFRNIGCATCHAGTLGTDACLHDMGAALSDGYPLWRTPLLVAARLRKAYLHDRRAPTIDAAIRAHGGEALLVADRYASLSARDRDALVRYVGGL